MLVNGSPERLFPCYLWGFLLAGIEHGSVYFGAEMCDIWTQTIMGDNGGFADISLDFHLTFLTGDYVQCIIF